MRCAFLPMIDMGLPFFPTKVIVPSWGWYTPVNELKSDVLPAPLGPMTASISPRSWCKLTSLSEITPPKRSVT